MNVLVLRTGQISKALKPTDYPVLSDLYLLIEEEYQNFDDARRQLFTAELLQEILLGLHSMCRGAEAPFFDGHTNITDNHFIVFGVKGLIAGQQEHPQCDAV